MNKKYATLASSGILGVMLIAVLIIISVATPISYDISVGQPMNMGSYLDPTVSHAPSVHVDNVEVSVYNAQGVLLSRSENHNLLTSSGKSLVVCAIGQGQTANSTCAPAIYIMLFNDSAYTPASGNVQCDAATQAKVENSYGLAPAAGTFAGYTGNSYAIGAWNVSKTFTLLNTPGSAQVLYGACLTTSATIAANNLFAAATFGSTATLTATNDNVKVTWQLSAA